MRVLLCCFIVLSLLINQVAVTVAATQETKSSTVCKKIDLRQEIKSFWYVPLSRERVHFVSIPAGDNLNKYVIEGDLLVSNAETPDLICAHYVKKGKVAASGWVRKSEIKNFQFVNFGAFDAQESKEKISTANKALISLAKHLPVIKDWRGTYQDINKNSVNIWKKGSSWRLDTTGIVGAIGTGNKEEDSQNLSTIGARAEIRVEKSKYDVCDIVIVGFNNALLATSGSHCMGSGANHEFPEFNGLYWRH